MNTKLLLDSGEPTPDQFDYPSTMHK